LTQRLLREGRRFGAALLLALLGLWLWASTAQAAAPQGELVLILEQTAVRGDAVRLADGIQGHIVASIPQIDAYLIDLPGRADPSWALLNELEQDPDVERAEASAEATVAASPLAFTVDDPYLSNAWHLSKINADVAWGTTMGSPSVTIAIVDTGIDYTHPDLSGKVTLGPDYGSNDSNPMDTQGHGTHVAGIAGAKANNGIGAAGVCPGCQLMAVKVFPDGSSSASHFAIAQGITWAADNGADVINLSLGGTSSSSTMQSAVDYAWQHGVVVVAAAGNSATSVPHYPGAYTNVIAVGSTTSSDTLSSFSNYGSWVDVTAPGSSIFSTIKGGGYQSWSGTSMASPVVAGAAGLAFSGLAGATNTSVRAAVEQAVTDLGTPGRDTTYGYGRIDLSKLFTGGGTPPPSAPSISTASLPGGTVGTPYSASLAASGGTTPYTWSLASGTPPAGITLSSAGTLSGTPTTAGSATFTVRVTDANNQTATKTLSITIAPAPPPPGGVPDLTGTWGNMVKTSTKVSGTFALSLSGAPVSSVTVRLQLLSSSGTVLRQTDMVVTDLAVGSRNLAVEWQGVSGTNLKVRAIIDPSNAVAESNETNNTLNGLVRG
jgi:thermitase